MHNKRPPLPALVIVLALIAAGIYYGINSLNPDDEGALAASGTIEAVIVNLSPEIAGRVTAVLAAEGESVKAGDPVLHLDDSLLTAQRAVAEAQLDSAKAALNTAQAAFDTAQQQYDMTLSNALAAERATRTATWSATNPADFTLPAWYFDKAERIKAAQALVDIKQQDLKDAQDDLEERVAKAGSVNFLEVEAQLAQTRLAYQNAQTVFDLAASATGSQDLKDAAQIALDDAQTDLDSAQKDYEDELTTEGAQDVLTARAEAMIAQEAYALALDQLRALQTGADSQQVITAGKALDQARAVLAQAQVAVNTAEANLALIDTQMKKLTVSAVLAGTILTRNVEPGEFVQPGAVALTMANLNELTITVYVPEDQYGKIALGQEATVTVDSFPGETFNAKVVHISDQAEFTPRNVQTVEGRSATVYAIKLKVTDSEGKLKIGMPADVAFR